MQLPNYRKSTIPENAKRVFEGVIFDAYQWEQELFDGSYATFEKLVRPDTVSIFPVLDDGHLLLIEDTQPFGAVGKTELRVPMGRVEFGETPEKAACREFREETGYEIGTLTPLYNFEYYEKIDWRIYAFLAKKLTKVDEPQNHPGEKVSLAPVSFDEFLELAAQNKLGMNNFAVEVLQARLDPEKMKALRTLFLG